MAYCILCKKENKYQDENFICFECKITREVFGEDVKVCNKACLEKNPCKDIVIYRTTSYSKVELNSITNNYDSKTMEEKICLACGNSLADHSFDDAACPENSFIFKFKKSQFFTLKCL